MLWPARDFEMVEHYYCSFSLAPFHTDAANSCEIESSPIDDVLR